MTTKSSALSYDARRKANVAFKWGSVTTVHAPAWLVRLHARYMRQIGAGDVIYFLDKPEMYSTEDIESFKSLATIVECNADYWGGLGGRPDKVPMRQLKNVSVARSSINADWVLHVDIDEYLFVPGGVDDLIKSMAADVCEIHIANAERVMIRGASNWHTGIMRIPNTEKEKQKTAYGPIVSFFGNGLAEYYHGKSIVKNRKNILQHGHGAVHADPRFEVIRVYPPQEAATILHYPAISEEYFIHRVRSKIMIPDEVKSLKCKHQNALERWISGAKDVEARARQAFRFMHTCWPGQAEELIRLGLGQEMPERFIKAIEQAAGDPRELVLSFADASIVSFYTKE